MKTPALFLLAAIALTASACSDRVVRSVVIDDGEIRPHRVRVPADAPFALTAAVIGERATTLTSPDLGLAGIEVPVNWINPISPKGIYSPGSLNKVRTELGPLAPGEYSVICECGGDPRTLTIVAGEPALARNRAAGSIAGELPSEKTTP